MNDLADGQTLRQGTSSLSPPVMRRSADGVAYVEKILRNPHFFRAPREIAIHRLASEAQGESERFTSRFLGARRGLRKTTLLTEFLPGPFPKAIEAVPDIGGFVGTVERRGMDFLAKSRFGHARQLDFFASGGHSRRRYDIDRIRQVYRETNETLIEPSHSERIFRECRASIAKNGIDIAGLPRTICHLDHYNHNFILVDDAPRIIDWGEGYIGRAGFDAGSYLMVLYRKLGPAKFQAETARFLGRYLALTPLADRAALVAAINRIFLPRSLWVFFRDDVMQSHKKRDKVAQWRDKILFLEACADGSFWRRFI